MATVLAEMASEFAAIETILVEILAEAAAKEFESCKIFAVLEVIDDD